MAPRERHHSDPKQTLIRSAASDILEGVFDVGAPPQQPPPPGAGSGGVGSSEEMKRKMRRQLEELDSQARSGPPKEGTVSELKESVDSYLRSQGELSDTESVTDPMEVSFHTPDGKEMQTRVERSGLVSDLKTAVQARGGETASNLLLGSLPLTDDRRPVYQLWSRERLGRRVGQRTCLRVAPRCNSG